uniref:Uncharacterized protein n=1 Tax=Onchocerca volvulus TaxID=6282 RepID=A0A8R1TVN2_ONCVO
MLQNDSKRSCRNFITRKKPVFLRRIHYSTNILIAIVIIEGKARNCLENTCTELSKLICIKEKIRKR